MIWVAAATSASRALATNGTWTDTTSGGLWTNTVDWSTFTVANRTDGIADFSTLNITSDDNIHLDTIRTIGQLKFGDTVRATTGSSTTIDADDHRHARRLVGHSDDNGQ